MKSTFLFLIKTTFLLILLALNPNALANSMNDLETLVPGNAANSFAYGVSSDGSLIVGQSDVNVSGTIYYHAFSYYSGVMHDLGTLVSGNAANSAANAVSLDASVIVGQSNVNVSGTIYYHAFSYYSDVMHDLGTLDGNAANSAAYGVSSDGAVIVGQSDTDVSGTIYSHAFSYYSGVMHDLGTLVSGNIANSFANGASWDGSVIVGQSDTNVSGTPYQHAFSYYSSVMHDLGTLDGDAASSYASGISSDGAVIVGFSNASISGTIYEHAFSYYSGVMHDLGTFVSGNAANSSAVAASSDGSVIVGQSNIDVSGAFYQHAFSYYSGVMHDLGTLDGNASNSYAQGVSSDGTVIVGFSDADVSGSTYIHAFVYKNTLIDVPNTYTALAQNGYQLNSLINLQTFALTSDLAQDCSVFGEHNVCVAAGARYLNVNSPTAQTETASLRAAYRFNPHFHAGAFLDQGISNQMPSNFKVDNNQPMMGVFGNLAQREDGTGTQLKVAAALSNLGTTITRSTLANTEAGQGSTQLNTQGFLAELAYGHDLSERWQAQPFVGLLQTNTSRKGYTENSGADFPATYNTVTQSATTAYAGARVNGQMTEKVTLILSGGVEQDLTNSMNGYTVSMNYFGPFSLPAPSQQDTRGFAALGASYALKERQLIRLDLAYSQQALNSANGTGAFLTYELGL